MDLATGKSLAIVVSSVSRDSWGSRGERGQTRELRDGKITVCRAHRFSLSETGVAQGASEAEEVCLHRYQCLNGEQPVERENMTK